MSKKFEVWAYAMAAQTYTAATLGTYEWQQSYAFHPLEWFIVAFAATLNGGVCFGFLRHLGLLRRKR